MAQRAAWRQRRREAGAGVERHQARCGGGRDVFWCRGHADEVGEREMREVGVRAEEGVEVHIRQRVGEQRQARQRRPWHRREQLGIEGRLRQRRQHAHEAQREGEGRAVRARAAPHCERRHERHEVRRAGETRDAGVGVGGEQLERAVGRGLHGGAEALLDERKDGQPRARDVCKYERQRDERALAGLSLYELWSARLVVLMVRHGYKGGGGGVSSVRKGIGAGELNVREQARAWKEDLAVSGAVCVGTLGNISDMQGKSGEADDSVQDISRSEMTLARRPRPPEDGYLKRPVMGTGWENEAMGTSDMCEMTTLEEERPLRKGNFEARMVIRQSRDIEMVDWDIEDALEDKFMKLGLMSMFWDSLKPSTR